MDSPGLRRREPAERALSTDPGLNSARLRVRQLVAAMAVICATLYVGVVLVALPWSRYWHDNYFSDLFPSWRNWWLNPYVRGAVSGLGFANLYLCLLEVLRFSNELTAPRRLVNAHQASSATMKTDTASEQRGP